MERRRFDNEFKVMIVELLQSGLTVKSLSKEYGLNDNMIRRWRKEYESRQGDFNKKKELTPEQQELRALKKQLRDVTLERDILKKAVSIFSKSDS